MFVIYVLLQYLRKYHQLVVCRGVFADFLPELAEITIYPTGLPQ